MGKIKDDRKADCFYVCTAALNDTFKRRNQLAVVPLHRLSDSSYLCI